MSAPAAAVEVTDVVLRDGFQDEPVIVPTDGKLRLARLLAEAGVPRLEVASFVNPRRVPQMADAVEVVAGTAGLAAETTVLALNGRGVRRAVESGARRIQIVASASDAHSSANAGRGRLEALADLAAELEALRAEGARFEVFAGISTAFVCPFEGAIAAERVAEIGAAFRDMRVTHLGLADTLGTAAPEEVLATVDAVRAALPELELSLHLHNAQGQALETVVAAAERGIRRFDGAVAGFGGCPFAPGAHGNIATEALVSALHAAGFATGLDEARLAEAAELARRLVAESPAIPAAA